MGLIGAAKRSLLKMLYEEHADGTDAHAIDRWFDEWVVGYYGHATVVPTKDEVYRDDPKYLEKVRSSLTRSVLKQLEKEDVFEEATDLDRTKRLIRMMVFVLKKPELDRSHLN